MAKHPEAERGSRSPTPPSFHGCCDEFVIDSITHAVAQINATNLSANYPLLSGAVVSLGMSLFCCIGISLIFPDKEKFRWAKFEEDISMIDNKVS